MEKYYPEGFRMLTATEQTKRFQLECLEEAAARGDILEARATVCDLEHNLLVDLGEIKGVIPHQEGAIGIASGKTKDIAIISRVNKMVCFQVQELTTDKTGKPLAVLSRRAAQEECQRTYIDALRPGDVIPAKVTHLESFGCFVDIGCGISSLIPIDSISVSRISHPAERFKVGQNIRVVVRSIDEQGRVLLSHKELLGTWAENAAAFSAGETVAGIVRSVENYGIFIELTPNLAGLAEPNDSVKVGQLASVYIKSLIPEKMKVKLILVDAFDSELVYEPPKYFFEGDHMDRFVYSPESCQKVIETVFS
mgnify:CR=1 FL=1